MSLQLCSVEMEVTLPGEVDSEGCESCLSH